MYRYRDRLITTTNPNFEREVELARRRREARHHKTLNPRALKGAGLIALALLTANVLPEDKEPQTVQVRNNEPAYSVAERLLDPSNRTEAPAQKVNTLMDEIATLNPEFTDGVGANTRFTYGATLELPDDFTPQN